MHQYNYVQSFDLDDQIMFINPTPKLKGCHVSLARDSYMHQMSMHGQSWCLDNGIKLNRSLVCIFQTMLSLIATEVNIIVLF